MKIVLDTTAAEWIFANFKKWDTIGDEKFDFPNWKRSPIDRENRRESIVYGNCADLLSNILMNATDENGAEWWQKLTIGTMTIPKVMGWNVLVKPVSKTILKGKSI